MTGLAGARVKGWAFNSVSTVQTGSVETIQTSSNLANTGQTADRPNATGLPYGGPGFGDGTASVNNWFNKTAFALNAPFTIGNLGRNTLIGPGFFQLDFGGYKNFRITERIGMQFRAELFNITNRVNFGNPNGDLNSSSFGQISGTSGAPLEVQFGLKVSF